MTPLRLGGRLWLWVAGGVAWGLLCVGVRVAALNVGREMNDLAARRHELLSRVQSLERRAAYSGQLEQIERAAHVQGFSKPGANQIVIVTPSKEDGILERFSRLVGISGDERVTKENIIAAKTVEKTVSPAKRNPKASSRKRKKAVKR